jgi:hypothetical protein
MTRIQRHLLPVLFLLFAQVVGVAHLTSHLAERLTHRQDTTHQSDDLCARCALFASVDSAPAAHAALPLVVVAAHQTLRYLAAGRIALQHVAAYRSRAPPLSA